MLDESMHTRKIAIQLPISALRISWLCAIGFLRLAAYGRRTKMCYCFAGTSSRGLGRRSLREREDFEGLDTFGALCYGYR
jgi:hypothetical protein